MVRFSSSSPRRPPSTRSNVGWVTTSVANTDKQDTFCFVLLVGGRYPVVREKQLSVLLRTFYQRVYNSYIYMFQLVKQVCWRDMNLGSGCRNSNRKCSIVGCPCARVDIITVASAASGSNVDPNNSTWPVTTSPLKQFDQSPKSPWIRKCHQIPAATTNTYPSPPLYRWLIKNPASTNENL